MYYSPARRRTLYLSTHLALLSTVSSFAATSSSASITIEEAINQAGRLRMLSQRVAKLYAQILMNVEVSTANKLLITTIELFDKQLANLMRFTDGKALPHIHAVYEKLTAEWALLRRVSLESPQVDRMVRIAELNEAVLSIANEATLALEKQHGSSLGRLVNLAGRQRMLSQRMAKFYFFWRKGLNRPDLLSQLSNARREFIQALTVLEAAPENTQAIFSRLDMAKIQWAFFDAALTKSAATEDRAKLDRDVAHASENLLEVMDELTGFYVTLK